MLPANALHGAPASLTVGLLVTLAPLAVEMPRALALLGTLPPLELRGALVLLTAEPFGRLVLPAVGLHGALTPLPVEPLGVLAPLAIEPPGAPLPQPVELRAPLGSDLGDEEEKSSANMNRRRRSASSRDTGRGKSSPRRPP